MGALILVGGLILVGANFGTVVAVVVFLASGLWTIVASIAVGAAYSVPIVFLGLPTVPYIGFPAFGPAVSGIVAGMLIAWLRMVFRTKEKYDPLFSSLFSMEGLFEGGWQFVWRFLADVSVGYLVMVVFASIPVVAATDHQFTLTLHEIGNGLVGGAGGGGFGGGGDGYLSGILAALAVVIFVAVLIGALSGAAIGAILGFGLCSTHVLHGIAQGATINVLLGRARGGTSEELHGICISGVFSGAVEGALVGIVCGFLTDWGLLIGKEG